MPTLNAYVDLSQRIGEKDASLQTTSIRTGPYSYGGNSSDGQIYSEYYDWVYRAPGNNYWNFSEQPPGTPLSNFPLTATRFETGWSIYNDWNGFSEGLGRNFAAIVAPSSELTYLKITQVASSTTPIRGTEQLVFSPRYYSADSSSLANMSPTTFNLNATGVAETQNWVNLPSIVNKYGPDSSSWTSLPGTIQAKVIADGSGFAVVARSVINGQVVALNGDQMSSILNAFAFTNSSITPQQSAFTFKVAVSGDATTSIPSSASSWIGNAGRSDAADTTTVYFDTLAPTPSDLIVAGNTLILSMNGANSMWPSSFNDAPGQVMEYRWNPQAPDSAIIPALRVTDGANGQVAVTGIESLWGGYQITLARAITSTSGVTLSYQPPSAVGDQISGVIQDDLGNDAAAFTQNATYYLPATLNGKTITATRAAFDNSDTSSDLIYFQNTSNIDSSRAQSINVSISGSTVTVRLDFAFRAAGSDSVSGYTNGVDQWVKQVTTISATVSSTSGITTGSLTQAQFQSMVGTLANNITGIPTIAFDAVGGSGSSASSAVATNRVERVMSETNPIGTSIPFSVQNNLDDRVNYLGGDSFTTGNFNDTIYGWAGNDTFTPGLGNDLVYGGFGTDTINFSNLTSSQIDQIQINLNAGGLPEVIASFAGNPRISTQLDSIENVIGSQIGDTINGNDANNMITGGLGNDTMSGGAGDDTVVINALGRPSSGVAPVFQFSNGWMTITTTDGVDVIAGDVEQVKFNDATLSAQASIKQGIPVWVSSDGTQGTEGADTITGSSASEEIRALGGDDTIFGSGGYDIINAGAGNDSVSYSRINLTDPTTGIVVQAISDPEYFPGGLVRYQNYSVIKPWDYAINPPGSYAQSIDSLINRGWVDTLVATEYITGTTRADFFIGAQAHDWFSGRGGNDTFYGGAGSDWVDYNSILPSTFSGTTGVVVNLSGVNGTALATSNPNSNLSGLNFTGSLAGQDALQGTARITPTTVNTAAIPTASISTGTDTITLNAHGLVVGTALTYQNAGAASAVGLVQGNTYYVIADGYGANTFKLSSTIGGTAVDITTTGNANQFFTRTVSTTDVLMGIENIRGTEFSDTLIGSAASNFLRGGTGNDIIVGGSDGLPGFATLSQTDWADYWNASGAVTVNLSAGVRTTSTTIEGITFGVGTAFGTATGADGSDTLYGIGGVRGGSSNDTLIGSADNDWLTGAAGNDTLVGMGGNDWADYKWATNSVTVTLSDTKAATGTTVAGVSVAGMSTGTATGADGNDTLYSMERIRGSRFNDTLVGNSEDNMFRPLDGNDTIDGGAGSDWINYKEASAGVTVNLSGPQDANGYISVQVADGLESVASTDRLRNIENIAGSIYNDTLIGNGGDNSFRGENGTDVLIGGAGSDTADYVNAAAGVTVTLSDAVMGSSLVSGVELAGMKIGSMTSNTSHSLFGNDGSDTLYSIENVRGSEFDDIITGNSDNNTITGGLGNDTMAGGAGDDAVVINVLAQPTSGNGPTLTFNAGSNWFTVTSTDGVDVISSDVELVRFNDRSLSVGLSMQQQAPVWISPEGTEGADTITGSSASEEIRALGGDDTIFGSGGYDIINAGAGNDSVSYSRINLTDPTTGIVVQAISDPSRATQNYTVIKPWNNYSQANLTTLEAAGQVDRLQSAEYITGTTRADFFIGAQAHDWFSGRGGNDTFYGGAGSDWVDYNSILPSTFSGTTGVVVNLSGVNGTALATSNPNSNLSGLNFTGSLAGQDALQGTARITPTTVNTAAIPTASISTGTDTITLNAHGLVVGTALTYQNAGAASAVGLVQGNTYYVIADGYGANTFKLSSTIGGTAVDITTTGNANQFFTRTVSTTDVLMGIENIRGTEFSDTLIGSAASNFLRGGTGNDIIVGGSDGLPGFATLSQTDWADYWNASGAVTVNLSAGVRTTSTTIEGITFGVGTAFGTATGADGSDTLYGIGGVRGGSSNDTLIGSADNDWLTGAAGNDTLVGMGGNDWADYKWATNSVTVTLSDTKAATGTTVAGVSVAGMSTGTATGADGNDTLYSMERIRGSRFNDTLVGNSEDNMFRPLDGNDTIDGGAGSDWINYKEASAGVTVNLSGPQDANGYISVQVADGLESVASTDRLRNIENIAGSIYNDTLIGNGGDNSFRGENGTDVLIGGAGSDTADYVNAAAGVTVTLSDAVMGSSLVSGVELAGMKIGSMTSNTSHSLFGNDGSDTLYSIENVRGSEFDDIITGNSDNNTITGGLGNDTMAGGAGDDAFIDVQSGDVVGGGDGNDTVTTAQSSFSLVDSANLTSVENLVSTSISGATLSGNEVSNRITGGAGNDTIIGAAGDDTIRGGAGNDYLDGGQGVDIALFSGLYTGYTTVVNSANGTISLVGADGADIISSSVEFVQFDGSNGISLDVAKTLQYGQATYVGDTSGSGNPAATITGTNSNDFLVGTSRVGQILFGLDGNDVLDGGRGNDTLIGGAGNDTYVVYSSADRVLETGTAASTNGIDTILSLTSRVLDANVENLSFTYTTPSSAGYMGIGNAANNTITGGAGIDRLYGRDGNDTLNGAGGNDFLYGGNGDDRLIGGTGNDALYGGAGNDVLEGGTGQDTLDGGAGTNTLIGGADSDVYQINSATNTIVELANEGTDTLLINFAGTFSSYDMATSAAQVENAYLTGSLFTASNLTGNALNNILYGNMAANTINGGAGNDTLWGDGDDNPLAPNATGANDSLIGGAGNDILYGQGGDDVLDGGTGNDTMVGGIGNDTYFVDNSSDVATDLADPLTGGIDWIVGSNTDIDLTQFVGIEHVRLDGVVGYMGYMAQGNAQTNTLIGNGGDNYLAGRAGHDTLDGGAGHDVLVGGAGNDTLIGGAGLDFADYGEWNVRDLLRFDRTVDYGYNQVTSLTAVMNPTSPNDLGIRANLDSTIQLGIAANTVIRSSNVSEGMDRVQTIEGITGTNFNDTLIGGAENNFLGGGRGFDTVVGGGGNDLLLLGAGTAYGLTVDMTALGIDFANQQTAATQKVLNLASLSSLNNAFADGTYLSGTDQQKLAIFNAPRELTVTQNGVTTTATITNGGNGLGTVTYWGMEGLALSGLRDIAYGTLGNDTIWGAEGSDTLFGGDGNDVLAGYLGTEFITSDTQNDTSEHDTLYGGNGNDTLIAGRGDSTLYGESGNDLLTGLMGNDTLFGGDGNDTLDGRDGNDFLNGGVGNDTITGGLGNDTLIGGGGTDVLIGGAGDDEYLYTGTETLTEVANGGMDKVMVFAGNTNATTFTLAENFEIAALGNSSNVGYGINVFTNVNTLIGNSANNLLLGNIDDNVISGGAGNDTLAGYGGDDLLTGGLGADLFVLNLNPSSFNNQVGGFGGQINDFNRTGANEGDRLLLNFKTTDGTGYAYSFNGGGDFGNLQANGPRAFLNYDTSTGLLEIRLQQSNGSGGWAFSSTDNTPDISYLITGANDTTAAVLNPDSFVVDPTYTMIHPMQSNGYLGQQA